MSPRIASVTQVFFSMAAFLLALSIGILDAWGQKEMQVEVVTTFGDSTRSHTDTIKNVHFLKGRNQVLSCSDDGSVALWDMETHRIVRRFCQTENNIYCMAVSPDQQHVIAGASEGEIHIWELDTGKYVRTIERAGSVFCIEMLGDSTFLAGDDKGVVRLHSVDEKEEATLRELVDKVPAFDYFAGTDDITGLSIAKNQKSFVSGDSDFLYVWDLETDKKEPVAKLKALSTWICCIRHSPDDSKIAASDYDGNVVLFDLKTEKPLFHLESISDEVIWLEFLDDKTLIAVDADGNLIKIDVATGEHVKHPIEMPNYGGFTFTPDKKQVITGGAFYIGKWSLDDFQKVAPSKEDDWLSGEVLNFIVTPTYFVSHYAVEKVVVRLRDTGEVHQVIDIPKTFETRQTELFLFEIKRKSGEESVVVCGEDQFTSIDLATGEIAELKRLEETALSVCRSTNPGEFLVLTESQKIAVATLDGQFTVEKELGSDDYLRFIQPLNDRFLIAGSTSVLRNLSTTDWRPRQRVESGDDRWADVLVSNNSILALTESGQIVGFVGLELKMSIPTAQDLDQWLEKLMSKNFKDREQATLKFAEGGNASLEFLEQRAQNTDGGEIDYRISKIKQIIATAGLPDLGSSKKSKFDGVEFVDVAPSGKYFACCKRNLWKSKLIVGETAGVGLNAGFVERFQIDLDSRPCSMQFVSETEFVVAYVNGGIAKFKMKIDEEADEEK